MSEQRVILVTGATSGIGAAIASRLAADGSRVFGTGRNATGETSDGVTLCALDVRSDDSVRHCVEDSDLKPFGIRVTMIEPGTIKTAFYSQPTVATMPEYSRWRDRAMKTLKEFEERAPGPDVVAKAVSNVVRSTSPPLRVKITREAHVLPFLKRILPDGLLESTLRSAYKLD